jgi:hypothetical protein
VIFCPFIFLDGKRHTGKVIKLKFEQILKTPGLDIESIRNFVTLDNAKNIKR